MKHSIKKILSYLIISLSLNGCASMKHVEPLDLHWIFVGENACLNKADVQALREYIIRLSP